MKNRPDNSNSKPDNIFKIKSINQRVYDALDKFGEIEQGAKMDDAGFNFNPRIVLTNFFADIKYEFENNSENKFSDHDSNYLWKYDVNSNLIEEIQYNASEKIKYTCKYNFINDQLKEIIYFEENDSSKNYTIKINYDSSGKLLDETKLNSENKIKYKIISKYDSNNTLIEKKEYRNDGYLKQTTKYNYRNGKLWKSLKCSAIGELISSLESFNESEGLRLSYFSFINGNRKILEQIRDFVRFVNVLGSNFGNDGNYEYNEIGLLIKINKSINPLEFKYEYDNFGNWIKKFNYRNEIPYAIVIREIEYY